MPITTIEPSVEAFTKHMKQIVEEGPREDPPNGDRREALYMTRIYFAPEFIESPLHDREALKAEFRALEQEFPIQVGVLLYPEPLRERGPGALLAIVGTLADLEGFLRRVYDVPVEGES